MTNRRFPRRSLLYSPGDQRKLLGKAFSTNADTLIFDLEDSVSAANKQQARENIVDLADEIETAGKEICVRINGVKTEFWADDLAAALEAGVDSIKVPMVEAVWELRTVLEAAERIDPNATVEVGIALETPTGIFAGREIAEFARGRPSITNINFGNADFINAIGAPGPSDSIQDILRFHTVSYARMGRMDPIGSALLEIDDPAAQRSIAERNREFGFTGMTAIHPDQVDVINEIFTPTESEVDQARRLVDAFESTDRDSIMVDGIFLDAPVVKRYRKVLERDAIISDADGQYDG